MELSRAALISVESQVGAETTFTIFLPTTFEASAAPIPIDRKSSSEHAFETILLTEDQLTVRELTQTKCPAQGPSIVSKTERREMR